MNIKQTLFWNSVEIHLRGMCTQKRQVTSFSDLPEITMLSSVHSSEMLLTLNKAIENVLRRQAGFGKVKRCLKSGFVPFCMLGNTNLW